MTLNAWQINRGNQSDRNPITSKNSFLCRYDQLINVVTNEHEFITVHDEAIITTRNRGTTSVVVFWARKHNII